MMNHWIIFPLLIPAVVAPLLILMGRFDQVLARVFSIGAMLLQLFVAGVLLAQTLDGQVFQYDLGNWERPFGIVLVLDRLSATMVLLSTIIGLLISMAAIDDADEQGRHFHALLLFQLMGVNGAFLTGDLFNQFVFFEVMLIASYGLAVHGGGGGRLLGGVQFVTINLAGSTLFLIAVGLIYAVTGGLNLQDLGERLPEVSSSNQALLSCGIALLFAVYGLKAGLIPFHFWLPGTYARSSPLVVALFALTTKVGIYSLIRFQSTVLAGNEEFYSAWATNWILPAGLLTILFGMIGVVASRSLGELASYATLASGGMIAICVGEFEPAKMGAGFYYLVHSTLAGACLFLVGEALVHRRPEQRDLLTSAGPFSGTGLLGSAFIVASIAIIGLPPLSGFIGKLLILNVFRDSNWQVLIWATILGTSLLGLMGFAKAGSELFWKSTQDFSAPERPKSRTVMTFVAIGSLIVLLLGMTVMAEPMIRAFSITAKQICTGSME